MECYEALRRYNKKIEDRRRKWGTALGAVLMLLILAISMLHPLNIKGQSTDFKKITKLKPAPVDTSRKHTDLGDYHWAMYFVDFTHDNVLDYGAYELEAYQKAVRDSLPTFAATWPGRWEHHYAHDTLVLIPTSGSITEATKIVSIEELDRRSKKLHEDDKSLERCGTKEKELSLFIPLEDPFPLPNLIIRTSPRVRLTLTRDRFTSNPEFDQGPRNAVEAVFQ